MARRLAAVDIGTNTLLLLVGEIGADGAVRAVRDVCRFGRLGQGLDRSGELAGEAIERSLAIAREFRSYLDGDGVEAIAAVGTQALREARNASDFLVPAQELLGTRIEVIGGEREAELVYRSVVAAFPELAAGDLVVADVGGGSTEVIAGRGGVITSLVSLPIGAVRLSERHLHGDPPAADEARALVADIDEHLGRLDPGLAGAGAALVGTAGTATTLAAVAQRLAAYDASRVQGFRIGRADIERLVARFLELTVAEKRRLPGLEPQRADVIAGGAAIYARLAAHLGADAMITSDRGVRWGLLHELAGRA